MVRQKDIKQSNIWISIGSFIKLVLARITIFTTIVNKQIQRKFANELNPWTDNQVTKITDLTINYNCINMDV